MKPVPVVVRSRVAAECHHPVVDRVTTTPGGVVVEADGPATARCPTCGRPSRGRHSRYWRAQKDLAASGRSVTLRVHVTRWPCRRLPEDTKVIATPILGGLHHEYCLARHVA